MTPVNLHVRNSIKYRGKSDGFPLYFYFGEPHIDSFDACPHIFSFYQIFCFVCGISFVIIAVVDTLHINFGILSLCG